MLIKLKKTFLHNLDHTEVDVSEKISYFENNY